MFWKTFLICTALTFTLPALADDRTTAKDVGKKIDETSEAIGKFTIEQRDDAVRSAKDGLDDLDARIGRMEADLERKWDKMDKHARKQAREALDALHRQRNELSEWYGGLKHGSAEAWEEVKSGFTDSYRTLRDSFARAKEKF